MLVDSHCHVHLNSVVDAQQLDSFYEENGIDRICLMSTNHLDFATVHKLASGSSRIVPSFGIHPWFAHIFTFHDGIDKSEHYKGVFRTADVDSELLSKLPEPIKIQKHFAELERLMESHAVVVIGEIGLDKLFKIPSNGYYNAGGEARLTRYRTHMEHQKQVFEFQIKYAFERGLPLSVHNVKAMGALIEIVQKLYGKTGSNIMLHSYTGSEDSLKLLKTIVGKDHVFVSVSWLINGELVGDNSAFDAGQLLIESDINVNDAQEQLILLRQVDSVIGVDNSAQLNRFLRI